MILVDTSVWVDHLGRGDGRLAGLLSDAAVLMHAFVLGEIALCTLRRRDTLTLLKKLPHAPVALPAEVLLLIEQSALGGLGVGYVDVHLLASARLKPGTLIWTRDKKLARVADALGLAFPD